MNVWLAFLIAVTIACALAAILLRWADSGALNTAVRCDTCHQPIHLKTDEDRDAYLRGQQQGHDYCPAHAPAAPTVTYLACATRGCVKTQDPKTGEYRCGTCGRSLALTKETAS